MAIDSSREPMDAPGEVARENAPDRRWNAPAYQGPHFGPTGAAPFNSPRPPFPAATEHSYGYNAREVARLILADPRLTEHEIAADFQGHRAAAQRAERQRDRARAAELGLTPEDLDADGTALYRAGIGREQAVRVFDRQRDIAAFTREHGAEPTTDDLRELDGRRAGAELRAVEEQTELAEADFYAARAGHGHHLNSLSQSTTQALGPMFREQGKQRAFAAREQVWLRAQGAAEQQDQALRAAAVPALKPGQARTAEQANTDLDAVLPQHRRISIEGLPREQLHKD